MSYDHEEHWCIDNEHYLPYLLKKEPPNPDNIWSMTDAVYARFYPWAHIDNRCEGFSSFQGLRNGKPVYLLGIDTTDKTEDEQKNTLIHELIHIYCRTRKPLSHEETRQLHPVFGQELEDLVESEARHLRKTYPHLIDELFTHFISRQKEITAFLRITFPHPMIQGISSAQA